MLVRTRLCRGGGKRNRLSAPSLRFLIGALGLAAISSPAALAQRSKEVSLPAPSFSFFPVPVVAGQRVNFNNESINCTTSTWRFGDGATSTEQNPGHTFANPGTYTVILFGQNQNCNDQSVPPCSNTFVKEIVVAPDSCGSGPESLCLHGRRFHVGITWRDQNSGQAGIGSAVSLSDDTGYFWFFTSNNTEVTIKVVDGSAVNGRFWVFYGAQSNVEYTIIVTDLATGARKTYFNPANRLASVSDTDAFAGSSVAGSTAAVPALERRVAGRLNPTETRIDPVDGGSKHHDTRVVKVDAGVTGTEANPSITEFPILWQNVSLFIDGRSEPHNITPGPDGALWFSDFSSSRIGRITTEGDVTGFQIPGGSAKPQGITTGPDGALWFAAFGQSKICRLDTKGGFSEYPLPGPDSNPTSIVTGPDKNLWFTEQTGAQVGQGDKIGRLSPGGDLLGEFALPTNSDPLDICVGPDGNSLWFTEPHGLGLGPTDGLGSQIGHINLTGGVPGAPQSQFVAQSSEPLGITSGPDGNLWFAEFRTNKIGRINPAGGVPVEFDVPPLLGHDANPAYITPASDGNLWFTGFGSGSVGRVTPGGKLDQFSVPSPEGASPYGIASGPDGNIWYANPRSDGTGSIGRVTVATVPRLTAEVNGPATGSVGTSVSFSARTTGGTPPLRYEWKSGESAGEAYQVGSSVYGHTYGASGTYRTAVRVTDAAGSIVDAGRDITITPPPAPKAPGAFTLSGSAHCNAIPQPSAAVLLTWTVSGGATTYRVFRNGSALAPDIGGVTLDDIAAVPAGQAYTYFVRAINSGGTTDSNSITVSVPANVCAGPAAPAALSPGSVSPPGSLISTVTPTFTWSVVAGATTYGLYIAIAPYGPANIVFSKTSLSGSSFTLPAGILSNAGQYSWTMTAAAGPLEGVASASLYFAVAVPAAPSPVYSITGASLDPTTSIYQVAVGQEVTFMAGETNAQSWVWEFGDGGTASGRVVRKSYALNGARTVRLTVTGNGTQTIGTSIAVIAINVFSPPCAANATTLCLNVNRFRLQVSWRVPSQGTSGVGTASNLTSDAGYFWFFSPNNVELIVKVVDGRGFNGRFWVFYGALSNVEYTITVTDTVTGAVKTYFNPDLTQASVADTSAF